MALVVWSLGGVVAMFGKTWDFYIMTTITALTSSNQGGGYNPLTTFLRSL